VEYTVSTTPATDTSLEPDVQHSVSGSERCDTARGQTASRIISNSIPEVVWHRDIKDSPSLPYLYDQVVDCFDFEEKVSLVSRLRDRAFSTTKAFVHVYSQMRITGAIDDSFASRTRVHHAQLTDGQHKEDVDLESTLWLMDYVMDRQRGIDWSETKVSYNHWIWMAHVILCLVWSGVDGWMSVSRDS